MQKKITKRIKIKILTDDFATFMGDDGKIYYGGKWKKNQIVVVPEAQGLRFIKQERAKRYTKNFRKE